MRKILGLVIISLLLVEAFVFVFSLFSRQNIFSPTGPPEKVGKLPLTEHVAVSDGRQGILDENTSDTHQDFVEQIETIPLPEDLPETVLLEVPFTPQAPFGDWADPRQDYGCEEASLLMASRWLSGGELTPEYSRDQIIAISDWELANYGEFHDSSAADTAKLFADYFGHSEPNVVYDISPDDIKVQLSLRNLVIVPVNGVVLDNPYFTPPGPQQHMAVVIGYDDRTQEFITNDPGTKRGESLRYAYENLTAALRDYETGHDEPKLVRRTAMIIIKSEGQQPAITNQVIKLPLALHLVVDSSDRFTTTRDFENLTQVVARVNDIWRQADIQFEVESIDLVPVISQAGWSPGQLIAILASGPNYKDGRINAYFVRQVGANGIAFHEFNSFLVADYTSVNDFRTAAHEIGHLLGLAHVFDSRGKLMFQGDNGMRLIQEEIDRARQAARDLVE